MIKTIKFQKKIEGFGKIYSVNHNFSMGFPGYASADNHDCLRLPEAVDKLKSINAEIMSAKKLTQLRLSDNLKSKYYDIINNGTYIKEGYLGIPDKEQKILLKESLTLSPLMQAMSKDRDYFYRSHKLDFKEAFNPMEYLEKLVEGKDYISIRDDSIVPCEKFGEDYRTVFLFEEFAKDYGLLLKEASDKPRLFEGFRLDYDEKPTVTQVFLSDIRYGIIDAHHWNDMDLVLGYVREQLQEEKFYSKEDMLVAFKSLDLEGITESYFKEIGAMPKNVLIASLEKLGLSNKVKPDKKYSLNDIATTFEKLNLEGLTKRYLSKLSKL